MVLSILQSLKRLFDPVEYRQEKLEQRRKLDAVEADEAQAPPPPKLAATKCRICDHRGTGDFCPNCLAGTMEPIT